MDDVITEELIQNELTYRSEFNSTAQFVLDKKPTFREFATTKGVAWFRDFDIGTGFITVTASCVRAVTWEIEVSVPDAVNQYHNDFYTTVDFQDGTKCFQAVFAEYNLACQNVDRVLKNGMDDMHYRIRSYFSNYESSIGGGGGGLC